MDLTTLLGIVLSIVFIGFGILMGGGAIATYISVSSIFIVVGGAFGAVAAAHPLANLKKMIKVFVIAFSYKESDPSKTILTLISFSEKARREGLLALEDDLEETEDDFLRSGVQLVVDGTEPEVVKNIMEAELDSISNRHEDMIKIFEDMGLFCPAYGMIGTLIGLIVMMSNLGGDASAIGQGMAAALITTLYGSILANGIFIPIAKKLYQYNGQEMLMKSIIVEGTLSIQSGDNPRILQQKLVSYFSPDVRKTIKDQMGE